MKKVLITLLLLSLLLLLAFTGARFWQDQQREQQLQALAQAASHWHLNPGELTGQGEAMQDSEHLLGGHWQLQGSRAVDLAGSEALMLRFEDGGPMSLFQLPAAALPRLAGPELQQSPHLRYARGLSVSLWQERDTVMLMVTAPEPDALAAPAIQAPQL